MAIDASTHDAQRTELRPSVEGKLPVQASVIAKISFISSGHQAISFSSPYISSWGHQAISFISSSGPRAISLQSKLRL